jgi:outer membrane protein OmpA-like peptidoglycan-associated protein
MGLSFTYFDEGSVDERLNSGELSGRTLKSYDMIAKAGYSYKLFRFLSLGIGGQYIYSDLAEVETSSSYSGNAGMMGNFNLFSNHELRIGASVNNVGTKVKFKEREFDQAITYQAGASYNWPIVAKTFNLIASGDAIMASDNDIQYRAGSELYLLMFSPFNLVFRGGYKGNFDLEDMTFGGGLNYNPEDRSFILQVDYAYTPLDILEDDNVHRLSLSLRFGGGKEKEGPIRKEEPPIEAALPLEEVVDIEGREPMERVMEIDESEPKMQAFELEEGAGVRLRLHINFDFDKAIIRPEEERVLNRAYDVIREFPNSMIHLEGHTDAIGTEEYNIGLSYRRVSSVLEYFVEQKGISRERFYKPVGYGETRPIAPNTTAEGRFKNRRVEIIIYKPEFAPPKEEGTVLQDVIITPADDGATEVVLVFNGNVYPDMEFILPNPSRLVVDVGNVKAPMGEKTYPAGIGNLKQVRVAPHEEGNFTRIVLDLLRNITEEDYTLETLGNKVIIKVK